LKRTVLLLILLLSAGCAQPRRPLLEPVGAPIVWPPAPDQPRVRFLGEIRGSEDFQPKKSFGQQLDEFFHGPAAPSPLVTPYAVAVHGDGLRVAVADTSAMCVHLMNLGTQEYRRIWSCGTPPRPLESPVAVTWVGDDLILADAKLHALGVIRADGREVWMAENLLQRPAGIAYSATNQLLYVSDAGAHAVIALELDGSLVTQIGSKGAAPGQFNCPAQLAAVGQDLFVIDALNFRVQRLTLDGNPAGQFGRKGDAAGDLALPKGVAADADGNLWIVDAHFENVQAFRPDGTLLMAFGREGHGPGEFWLPAGAYIDAQNRLWIADSYNRRVQVFELIQ
jgi:hypothetical protein